MTAWLSSVAIENEHEIHIMWSVTSWLHNEYVYITHDVHMYSPIHIVVLEIQIMETLWCTHVVVYTLWYWGYRLSTHINGAEENMLKDSWPLDLGHKTPVID